MDARAALGRSGREAVLAEADRIVDADPPLRELVAAFAPVFAFQEELRAGAPGWGGEPPDPGSRRFADGVWLLADSGFQDVNAPAALAAREFARVMAKGFPALAGQCETLGRVVAAGEALLADLPAAAGTGKALREVTAETAELFAMELARPFIEGQARDLADLAGSRSWWRGACPVCGGRPAFSMLLRGRDETGFIADNGARRWLVCSHCATGWRCKRVHCPACGCEDPEELSYFTVADRPGRRIDLCRRCKTSMPCLDAGEAVSVPPARLAVLAMLPLELRAGEMGFARLAPPAWSGLRG